MRELAKWHPAVTFGLVYLSAIASVAWGYIDSNSTDVGVSLFLGIAWFSFFLLAWARQSRVEQSMRWLLPSMVIALWYPILRFAQMLWIVLTFGA